MFFKFDRDRSGTLEKQETYSCIRSLGIVCVSIYPIYVYLCRVSYSGGYPSAKLKSPSLPPSLPPSLSPSQFSPSLPQNPIKSCCV